MDFKAILAKAIADYTKLDVLECEGYIETPPSKDMGDFSFPCFKLAKVLRKAPPAIAQELAAGIAMPEFVSKCMCIGGYLNFSINPAIRAKAVLDEILQKGERYGASDEGKGKTICIDYSSINIAKRCHIGHLTTTVLGNALNKIYTFLGYKCVGINHLGDWGTQFGKLLCAYKHWSNDEEIAKGGLSALVDIYVRFEREADEAMQDEARAWFKKIEDDDAEATKIFEWFKEITLKDVAIIYELLDITFDSYDGESFFKDKWQSVIEELKQKNMLALSEGAYVVKLDEYDMPPCLMLKADGASLYATRDMAAAFYRKKTYDFYKCLYVVAYQQNLHFKQFIKVIDLMGYEWAKDLVHVPFGMVSFEGETLSTRKGHVVYLEDLLVKSVEKALEIINEKNPTLANKELVAKQVGIGAVIFFDLYNNRIKDVDFWWERALNFDGETAPYVQYTHARCCSVLAKAENIVFEKADYSVLDDIEAQALVVMLGDFPQIIKDACEKNEPSIITRFCADIAQAYNRFYYERRILDQPEGILQARLALTYAAKTVIKTALGLIGIGAPERM